MKRWNRYEHTCAYTNIYNIHVGYERVEKKLSHMHKKKTSLWEIDRKGKERKWDMCASRAPNSNDNNLSQYENVRNTKKYARS